MMSDNNKLYNYLVNQKYILLAYLFHPQEQKTEEQVDVGVMFQDGLSNFKKRSFRFKLRVELTNILEKPVEVTILNNVPSVLREHAVKFTQPIFVRNSEKDATLLNYSQHNTVKESMAQLKTTTN